MFGENVHNVRVVCSKENGQLTTTIVEDRNIKETKIHISTAPSFTFFYFVGLFRLLCNAFGHFFKEQN